MKPEQFNPLPSGERTAAERGKTTTVAERVKKFVSLGFRVELLGGEKLREIPANKHLIFLTTHMSNHDMPVAIAALAEEKNNLKIAEASTHENFSQNPTGYLGRKAIGEGNSFSIEYTGGQGEGDGIFNPDNYEPMKQALEDGYDMVVAAHFDPQYRVGQWRLPKKGGHGGVYLANITPDSLIVPVAVDIRSAESFGMKDIGIIKIIKEKRPKAQVSIGEPLEPTRIEGLDRFADILRKRKQGVHVNDEERELFGRVCEQLRLESSRVMEALANLLPQGKRPILEDRKK